MRAGCQHSPPMPNCSAACSASTSGRQCTRLAKCLARRRSMTAVVNMHQAKTQLSKLVERVRRGEEVVIAKNGKPVAKLTSVTTRKKPEFGFMEGQIVIRDNFND